MMLKTRDVLVREEAEAIKKRREIAAVPPDGDKVGLALSGGGIRSAVYNLGFLQGLTQRGFMPVVDYLCSVSGGGYIAGHYAALADSVYKKAGTNFHKQDASRLGLDETGKLMDDYRFRHVGEYLISDALGAVWRYVLYSIPMLGLAVSLLGIVGCLAGLFWRAFDLEVSRQMLTFTGMMDLGFQLHVGDEGLVALLPCVIPLLLLVCGIVIWVIRHCRGIDDATEISFEFLVLLLGLSLVSYGASVSLYFATDGVWRFSAGLLSLAGFGLTFLGAILAPRKALKTGIAGLGIFLLVSLAVFLGNGETAVGMSSVELQLQEITIPLLALTLLFFVPLIRFQSVVTSHQEAAPLWQQLGGRIIVFGACLSAPFFMVHWMSRENLSHYITYRDGDLHRNDVLDWKAFVSWLESHKLSSPELSGNVTKSFTGQEQQERDNMGEPTWKYHINLPVISLQGTWRSLSLFARHFFWFVDRGDELGQNLSLWRESCKTKQMLLDEYNGGQLASKSLASMLRKELSDRLPQKTDSDGKNKREESLIQLSQQVYNLKNDQDSLLKMWRASELNEPLKEWRPDEIKAFNRQLLEVLYPEMIRVRTMVTTTVLPPKDQQWRGIWLMCWGAVFAFCLFFDWNRISPFYVFYREKLGEWFIGSAPSKPKLSEIEPWLAGAPYPIFLASLNLFGRVSLARHQGDLVNRDIQPANSAHAKRCHPFILSPLYCGSRLDCNAPLIGLEETKSYCGGELTVEDAVALSGAAVTPFMTDDLGLTTLMAAFNIRIGQWLPRPGAEDFSAKCPRARPYSVGQEFVKSLFSNYDEKWRLGLIADGGFHEFFGLEELLLRGCKLIVVSDAGCQNGKSEFGALADALRMIRITHGIQFWDLDHDVPIDLRALRRNPNTNTQPIRQICFRAIFPEDLELQGGVRIRESIIVYCQMALTGEEEIDLQQFRKLNPNFPDEPTTNQFYTAEQVESYRHLGCHSARAICRAAPHKKTKANQENAENERNQQTAENWIGWFCETYIEDSRGVAREFLPQPAANAPANDERQSKRIQAAHEAVHEYLNGAEIRRDWHYGIDQWIRAGMMPKNLEHAFVRQVQRDDEHGPWFARLVTQLVLACVARAQPNEELDLRTIFVPGSRKRLCKSAADIVHSMRTTTVGAPFAIDVTNEIKLRQRIRSNLHRVGFKAASRSAFPTPSAGANAQDIGPTGNEQAFELIEDLLINFMKQEPCPRLTQKWVRDLNVVVSDRPTRRQPQ